MKKYLMTICAFLALSMHSDDLLSIYQEALEKDPNYNLNKADLDISGEFLKQARSGLGPRLSLSVEPIGMNTTRKEFFKMTTTLFHIT